MLDDEPFQLVYQNELVRTVSSYDMAKAAWD